MREPPERSIKICRSRPGSVVTADGFVHQAIDDMSRVAYAGVFADVPEARAELLHADHDRIVVVGRTFVGARLTPAAYAHGLALALPEKAAMARPTGSERADAMNKDPEAKCHTLPVT